MCRSFSDITLLVTLEISAGSFHVFSRVSSINRPEGPTNAPPLPTSSVQVDQAKHLTIFFGVKSLKDTPTRPDTTTLPHPPCGALSWVCDVSADCLTPPMLFLHQVTPLPRRSRTVILVLYSTAPPPPYCDVTKADPCALHFIRGSHGNTHCLLKLPVTCKTTT